MQLVKDKIDQLNSQAWDVRVSDSTLAFELSKEAVKLSREIGYTKTKMAIRSWYQFQTTVLAYLKKFSIKYFNRCLQPGQQDKEGDWNCHWRTILSKHSVGKSQSTRRNVKDLSF